ncbi:MAG: hypothetical protein OEV12_11280 [Gammaproteobacteria bacterium]|jgi:hypothetical protein|nr:hypothetical protein [Gammaproteobacteria bacterium]MDH3972043.1 hypothetical protein [Gammaproteobacteria bacterium]MDH3986977.1 hypothetical protein [Gammaproteobacteria bacterium]
MNTLSNSDYTNITAESEQNRRVVMLMLLSKLGLALLIGAIYAGVRFIG